MKINQLLNSVGTLLKTFTHVHCSLGILFYQSWETLQKLLINLWLIKLENDYLIAGSTESVEVMKEVMNLLKPINASNLRVLPNFNGGDNNNWVLHGVPGASLDTQNDKYFFFHHTEGKNLALW